MTMVGPKATARELKEKLLKKPYRGDVRVIGKLEACAVGENDNYFHIHNDEQIPANVEVFLRVR